MRIAGYTLVALNVLSWGGLSLLGSAFIWTIIGQHAAGYPNMGQIVIWLVIPLAVLLLSLARPVLRFRAGEQNLGVGLLLVTLALMPFYAVVYAPGA